MALISSAFSSPSGKSTASSTITRQPQRLLQLSDPGLPRLVDRVAAACGQREQADERQDGDDLAHVNVLSSCPSGLSTEQYYYHYN